MFDHTSRGHNYSIYESSTYPKSLFYFSILWLLYFTLNFYFVVQSAKQGVIKNHFWVFAMTRSGIVSRTIIENSPH